jgi:hypothetical protein
MRTLKELILPDFQIMKQYDELQKIIKEHKIFQNVDEQWQWFVIDNDGKMYYYVEKPVIFQHEGKQWKASSGDYKRIGETELVDLDWELSLVERKK